MSKRFRFFLAFLIVAIGAWFFYPTVRWYFFIDENQKILASSSKEQLREYAIAKAKEKKDELAKMITENGEQPLPAEFSFLKAQMTKVFKEKGEAVPKEWKVKHIAETLLEADFITALEDRYKKEIDDVRDARNSSITPGLDLSGGMKVQVAADFATLEKDKGKTLTAQEKADALNGAIEVLKSRVDKFGVSEPVIRQQGTGNIVIELPGAADPERIREVIRGKGRLNFHIVDDEGFQKFLDYTKTNPTGPYLKTDNVTIADPVLADMLGPNLALRKVYSKDRFGIDIVDGYAVVKAEPGLSGLHIQDASVTYDPLTNEPRVIFSLDASGGDIFYKLTSENKGKRMAVILDDKIKGNPPTINDAIRQNVQVTGFDGQESKDLALVLKTGALPVPLEIISQEAVGASLGEDAIMQGFASILAGLILVFLFMFGYYVGSGLIAIIANMLAFFLLAATLSMFNFTLTLTGIAGFVLTVGMAVDSNVIIYERIKEELALGKSRAASIKTGFHKAFSAILDSNVTTVIAAIALVIFGKGPVQGFAVMLGIGVVCSMIAALFFSRLLFDFNTEVFNAKKVSISWRRT